MIAEFLSCILRVLYPIWIDFEAGCILKADIDRDDCGAVHSILNCNAVV